MDTKPAASDAERDASAHVLALLLAHDGSIASREVSLLHDLDAFRRIAVTPQRFGQIVHEGLEPFAEVRSRSWLLAEEERRLNDLLDTVVDPQRQRLVCALATAVRRAGGHACDEGDLVYDHTLARWHIDRAKLSRMVAAAAS